MQFLTTTILLTICWLAIPANQSQQLDSIPAPQTGRQVVDHARAIPDFAISQLEELCGEIDGYKKSQLVILTVNDTGGRDPVAFATAYFNQHGIGESTANNGILVFAAMQQRTAAVIVGEGLDNEENRAICEKIAQEVMGARFRRNDPAGAMYGGGFAAARELLGHADLANRLERETNRERRLRKSSNPKHRNVLWWLLGGGTLAGGVVLLVWSRWQVRYGGRDCDDCQAEMVMLDEVQDDAFLDPPEKLEEELGSADYDVWACLDCNNVVKYRYGKFLTRYSKCPSCQYQTKLKVSRTLVHATTKRGGQVQVTEDCKNCDYHQRYTYATPRLPEPDNDSSDDGFNFNFGGGSSRRNRRRKSRGGFRRRSGGSRRRRSGGSRRRGGGSSRGGGSARW